MGGAFLPGDLIGHGFVYYGSGSIEDLNNLVDPSLGWTIDDAVAINDSGVIAAAAFQQGGGLSCCSAHADRDPRTVNALSFNRGSFRCFAVKARAPELDTRFRGACSQECGLCDSVAAKLGNARAMVRVTAQIIALFVVCTVATWARWVRTLLGIRSRTLASCPARKVIRGLNALGQVVGSADTYTRYTHAFLYTGSGPLVNLGSFGGMYSVSVATGINNSGMIIGYSDEGGNNPPWPFFTRSAAACRRWARCLAVRDKLCVGPE